MTHISQSFPDLLNHFMFGGLEVHFPSKRRQPGLPFPSHGMFWSRQRCMGHPLLMLIEALYFAEVQLASWVSSRIKAPGPVLHVIAKAVLLSTSLSFPPGRALRMLLGGSKPTSCFWGFLTAIGAGAEVLLCSHLCKRWFFSFYMPYASFLHIKQR